jgi:hypothetical protein
MDPGTAEMFGIGPFGSAEHPMEKGQPPGANLGQLASLFISHSEGRDHELAGLASGPCQQILW